MDNLDDSENTAKISDSAYSNSCSNSQSRRSHSSKSTRSGSNSSGSSGYGGKLSVGKLSGGYSDKGGQAGEKRAKEKDEKKKKQTQTEIKATTEVQPPIEERVEEKPAVVEEEVETIENIKNVPLLQQPQADKRSDNMEIATPDRTSSKDESGSTNTPMFTDANLITKSSGSPDSFSCVISMHDGVVMYTTSSLTSTLGFPKEMWIGRSFIDFVHPRDRNIFASHITSGLALPKNVNSTQIEDPSADNTVRTMVCRIRKCRNLSTGFGVKERGVSFMPFLLKLTFKNICDEEGTNIYLVIRAAPFLSAFKTPNEVVLKPVPFVIRHSATGDLEYIDPESVPYLGYVPQDLAETDALQLYHPNDLIYLRQVYETIVREGAMARCKAYRLLSQNGDFVKVETEWSSFINPWSRKLEFVSGKHYIVEGPTNPDVFQIPDTEKALKIPEEERNRIRALRENIIRVINEILTKPAEVAKQQMSKRCQDLATFMESLMEEQPKPEDELRLELQDADHSYYERDSVMLGGISPHHDNSDSKSSTGTPLSYNQLNYNETLQRYFDSHQPFSYDEYNTDTGENILTTKPDGCYSSSLALKSGYSNEMSLRDTPAMIGASNIPVPMSDYMILRLTESVISKHNKDMEKDLLKKYRETRSSTKGEREKVHETRQKKKDHLARCNAAFQPTSACNTAIEAQSQGLKRASKQAEADAVAHKHHCSAPRESRRLQSTSAAPAQPTTAALAVHWPGNTMNNMNTFFLGVGIPQQMPYVSPMTPTPDGLQYLTGMIPMYYGPTTSAMPSSIDLNNVGPSNSNAQFQQPALQCMMYGQAVYGQPFIYSPISPQVSYPIQQNLMAQSMYTNPMNYPLGLTSSNYEEVCKPGLTMNTQSQDGGNLWRDKKLTKNQTKTHNGTDNASSSNALDRVLPEPNSCADGDELNSISISTVHSTVFSTITLETPPINFGKRKKSNLLSNRANKKICTLDKSTEAVPETLPSSESKTKGSEETVYRTDGESSYSSFYSSFFKTESGSADDSGDAKKNRDDNRGKNPMSTTNTYYEVPKTKKIARRKMEPPWMEQVSVTSELVYKYKIHTRSVEEVLKADKLRMTTIEQPSLVNEQLGQLYLDLQLEGVASRLTLEEGITSSSSSGDEANIQEPKTTKLRKKRDYSKLEMIYEEDAPLPPCPEELSPQPSTSTQ